MWRRVLSHMTLWDSGTSHSLECHRSQWSEGVGAWGTMFWLFAASTRNSLARASPTGTVHTQELGKKVRPTCDREKRKQRIPDSLKDLHTLPTSFVFQFLS